jgi:hypothetical protein
MPRFRPKFVSECAEVYHELGNGALGITANTKGVLYQSQRPDRKRFGEASRCALPCQCRPMRYTCAAGGSDEPQRRR